jgi:deoxyribose-phosphate aldolase
MIDHTILMPDTVSEQILELCAQAREHHFATVCVQPVWAPLCLEKLEGSDVGVAAVAGFPQGATLPAVKAFEARQLMELGVGEVDMVMNVGKLKDGDFRLVFEDVAGVADEVHDGGGLLKVIIETGLLTEDEKVAACVLCQEAGADFVKTATGFNGGGATAADIALMRFVVGPSMGVKASKGVRTGADALALIAAGANRIGTSGSLGIVMELAGAAPASGEAVAAQGDAY